MVERSSVFFFWWSGMLAAMWRWAVLLGLVEVVAIGQQKVPFVGCPADGQAGPVDADEGSSVMVEVNRAQSNRLALYSGVGLSILAPKDWFCFATYGSSGEQLYVSPKPINSSDWFRSDGHGFEGPGLQVSHTYGDTSGRWIVAEFIARVFPDQQRFYRGQEEELFFGAPIPRPYPTDKIQRMSDHLIAYVTPANSEGLGTRSNLLRNGQPIEGNVLLVGEAPDLWRIAIRLPADLRSLTESIKRHFIAEAENSERNGR